MKKFTISILLISALFYTKLIAQLPCTPCTPVFSNCPPAGGLCGHLDTAYANHFYDKQINFYMPKSITDPAILSQCLCSQVNLRVIDVTGVSGLPAGITYTLNNGGHYNVQGGDSIGCAHFCGTPLIPGLYSVQVYLLADVTAIATPIGNQDRDDNAQSYFDTLLVLPDTVGGVASFTYGNNGSSACDSITVSLNALYTATVPNFVRYFWNIDGQATEEKTPGTFTYESISATQSDTFPITLSTVFYNFRVKKVHIGSTSGGYCGDIEEISCSCISGADSPDPYVKFTSLGFNNDGSAGNNNCHIVEWDNLNLSLAPGTQTLAMEVWDIDTRTPIVGSQDDLLGTYTLNVGLGAVPFHNANVDGWVEFDTIGGTTVTETLNVIVSPYPELPLVLSSQDTFCATDSVRISLDKSYSGCSFEWFRDTVYLPDATDTVFYTNLAGEYRVKITNVLTGCRTESASKRVIRMQSPPSTINIVFNGTQAFANPFPSSGYAVDWYYEGNLVTNQHGKFLPYLGDGLYEAQVYNIAYPPCRTIANSKNVNTGIDDGADISLYAFNIFPNPNTGKFKLEFATAQTGKVIVVIRNLLAQSVFEKQLGDFNGEFSEEIDLGNFGKGVYVVTIETEHGTYNRKAVVE